MRSRAAITVISLIVVTVLPTLGHATATDVAGVPAASVGVHGPTTDYTSGALELVGHASITPPGAATPLGNNGAVALIGNCAYVGRWHNYGPQNAHLDWVQYPVQIVDVADPANPTVVGAVPSSSIPNAVAREIRAIDLPNGFKMLTVLTFSKFIDEGAYVSGQNAMYFYTFPSGSCTAPVLTGRFLMNPVRPHEFYQWLDPNPAHNVPATATLPGHPRILEYITAPLSGVDGIVVDASNPAAPVRIGVWHGGQPAASATEANLVGGVPVGAGRYSHSISLSPDGTKAYTSQWDGGFLTFDASDFATAAPVPVLKLLGAQSIPFLYGAGHPGNTHSAVPLAGTNDVVVGDEIYVTTDGCPFGWLRVLDQGDATHPPSQIGEFRLPENNAASCSGVFTSDRNADGKILDGTFTMHNQTLLPGFVLTSWYGGGLRAIDVSNPAAPAEVGFFVPMPLPAIASIPDTSAPVYGKTAADTSDDWWVSTWSYPVIRGGLIYVTDIRNGLYILKAAPSSGLATALAGINFLEGNSNLGDFLN